MPAKYFETINNAEKRINAEIEYKENENRTRELGIHDLRNSLYCMPLKGIGFFARYEFLQEPQEIGDPTIGEYFKHPIADLTEKCYPYHTWTRRTFTSEDKLRFAEIFKEGLRKFRERCLIGYEIEGFEEIDTEFGPGYLQEWGKDSYDKVIRILEEEFWKTK